MESDGRIRSKDIATGAVNSRALDDLRSSNYDGSRTNPEVDPGTEGWQILKNGFVVFNDVTVRGDIVSANWDGANPAELATEDDVATAGFAFDSSEGSAQFEGDIFIGANGSLFVRDGQIVVGDPSGEHFSLGTTEDHDFLIYSGDSTEISEGYLAINGLTGAQRAGAVFLASPELEVSTGNDGRASILLYPPIAASNSTDIAVIARGDGTTDALVHIWAAGKSQTSGTILLQAQDGVQLAYDGSAAAPALEFFTDTDTGMYLAAENAIGFSAGAEEKLRIVDSGSVLKFDFVPRRGSAFVPMEVGAADSGGSGFRVVRVPN